MTRDYHTDRVRLHHPSDVDLELFRRRLAAEHAARSPEQGMRLTRAALRRWRADDRRATTAVESCS